MEEILACRSLKPSHAVLEEVFPRLDYIASFQEAMKPMLLLCKEGGPLLKNEKKLAQASQQLGFPVLFFYEKKPPLALPFFFFPQSAMKRLPEWLKTMRVLFLANEEPVGVRFLHRIRSPLSTLRVSLEMLEGGDQDMEIIETMKRSVLLIQGMVRAGMIAMQDKLPEAIVDEVCFGDVLERILPMFAIHCKEKRIQIRTEGENLILLCHAPWLEEILQLLIENAVAYSRRGSVVTVSAVRKGEGVSIKVSDGGPGIKESEVARVFHKYYRGEVGVREHPEGSGLGLYVSRRLVEQMGGKIFVKKNSSKGVTFAVTLPQPNHAIDCSRR